MIKSMSKLTKHTRISGDARLKLQTDLLLKYQSGATVRGLAAEIGRSYGFTHKILTEARVQMRNRGVRPASEREAPYMGG